jgi:hypothetical protein
MDISREVATAKGPAATFTGEVWIDPITRGLPKPYTSPKAAAPEMSSSRPTARSTGTAPDLITS